jgi:hypothetical protein
MELDYEENFELDIEDMGYTSNSNLPNLEHARDFMRGVLEAVYETGDTSRLDDCLEEVCHVLDLKFEQKDIKLESIEKQNRRIKIMENSGNKHHSFEIDKIVTALIKAQAEIEPAKATKVNSHFRNKYSTLADCFEACRVPLLQNGIATMQYCETIDGKLYLITMLAHTSGQWMKSIFPVISKDQTSQSIGSAVTYAKRYSLCAIVGIVTDEENKKDDDGESSLGRRGAVVHDMPDAELEAKMKPINTQQYEKLEAVLAEQPERRANLLVAIKTQFKVDSLDKMPVGFYNIAMKKLTNTQPVKIQEAN